MFLLQMAGFPGSGKSTIAKKISKSTNAIIIDRDIIKNSMLNSGIKDTQLAEASYRVVYDLASYYLSLGFNVIIDTPCYYKEIVHKGLEICEDCNVLYKYIECIVDSYENIERRLNTRERLATQISSTTREMYTKSSDKSVKPKYVEALTVNTTSNNHYDFDKIINYVCKE